MEISGYIVAARLVDDLEQIGVTGLEKPCSGTIYWCENVSEAGDEAPASVEKAADRLRREGSEVEVGVFADPPLWQLHKRDTAPQLLQLTAEMWQ